MTLLDIARKKETTIQKVSEEIKQLTGIDIGWNPNQIIDKDTVKLLNSESHQEKDITQNKPRIKDNTNNDLLNKIASTGHHTNQQLELKVINSDNNDTVTIVQDVLEKGVILVELNKGDRIILGRDSFTKKFKVKKGYIVGLEYIDDQFENTVDEYTVKYVYPLVEWQQWKIKQALDSHETIRGKIIDGQEYIGYSINIYGINAHLKNNNIRRNELKVNGSWMSLQITKAEFEGSNFYVVVADANLHKKDDNSRKIKKESTLKIDYDQLEINSVVDVTVERINDKSVFVKYKELRGIIYGSDLFWGYVTFKNHISEGERIKVKVVEKNIDEKGNFNVRFNHKDCLPNPWEQDIYVKSQIVEGPVIKVDDRGVVIKIGEGIEGYLYINDMTKMEFEALKQWKPSNGNVNIAIKSVNQTRRQIYLTTFPLSQEMEDEWKKISLKYEVNKAYHSKVITHDDTFLWVQLDGGLEASIHKNELSWSRSHGKELDYYHINDDVIIFITSIDITKRIIKASIRELLPNPWETASISLKIGDKCLVEVIEKKNNALIVETQDSYHLIGSIRMSELSWFPVKQDNEPQIGWKLEAKIMVFQPNNCVLIMSVKHLQEDPWNSLYLGAEVYGTIGTKHDSSFVNIQLENKLLAKTPEIELASQSGKKYPFKIVSCNRATQEIIVSHNNLIFDQKTEEIVKAFFNF